MPDRYWFQLSICLVAFTLVTAGCVGPSSSEPTTESTNATLSEMADHLDINRDLTANYTYYAENDTVKYIEEYRVTVNSSTGEETKEAVYGTAEADIWMKQKGATIAAQTIRKKLSTNVSNQSIDGITVEAGTQPKSHVAVVWTRNKVGNTEQTPTILQQTLRESLPDDITVTLVIDEKQVTHTYGITVEERTKS